ncbi:MAG: ATP-binding protein [Flavobacteriales bacterium]|nr:ATP-binding protein [Flavobacteriales bacterium]
MGRIIGILIWITGILAPHFLFGLEELVLTDDFYRKALGSELGYYIDETGQESVREIRNKEFQQIEAPRPNLGFAKGALWVKFLINNQSSKVDYRIHVNQPVIDSLEFFILNDQGMLICNVLFGESLPFDHRKYSTPSFVLDQTIPEDSKRTVFIRIVTEEQIVLPIYVATIPASGELIQSSNVLLGAYFGLILVMAVYNLFIYFTVKDRSYILYVIYVLAVGSTQAVLEGYMHQFFWPDSPWFAARSPYVFTAFVSITGVVFLQDFLKTKKYAPRINLFAKVIYLYFGLICLGTIILGINPTVHVAAQLGITVVSFYILLAGIVVYRRGYSPAKFFILAWAVLVIGIIVYALQDAGLIPSNPITNYMMLSGSAVETALLSIALADRINILKREKSESQQQALRISIENERIVKEQNVILEEKVSERTADLKNSNKKLNSAIEELKETQSQLVQAEKMASLGQLTAGVAHEINNPINFVSANIEPLKYDVQDILNVLDMYDSIQEASTFDEKKIEIENFKKEIDIAYSREEISKLLDGIKEGATRTADIVKGLKNFSRIDNSDFKEIDINEGIRSTFDLLANGLAKNLDVVFDLAENLNYVECMGGKINQVLLNIMNNALQAMNMDGSKKTHQLLIKSGNLNDDKIFISIQDTGVGMNDDIKNRIFEPFFTTKEVGQGTGLGLSIAYKIIETHKGEIYVESKEGDGSTFRITLPVKAK